MRDFLMRYAELAVMAACLVFVFLAASPWNEVPAERLALLVVGDCEDLINNCCIWGAFTTCENNAALSCLDPDTLYCADGETYNGTCTDATCQGGAKYQYCNVAIDKVPVDQCVTNGLVGDIGCPEGLDSCSFSYTSRTMQGAPTVTVCICNSGSLCMNNQPAATCSPL